jgi:hypothetical protein
MPLIGPIPEGRCRVASRRCEERADAPARLQLIAHCRGTRNHNKLNAKPRSRRTTSRLSRATFCRSSTGPIRSEHCNS